MLLLAIFGGLLTLSLIGLPIAFAIGGIGLIGVLLSPISLMAVPLMIFNSAESYSLVAIPLFMLTGAIVEKAGLGRMLIDFASSLVGWMRGGLAQMNVIDSLLFGGISGSAAADVASIGQIMITEMTRRGYPRNFTAALTSSTAELAILIPPSIPLIVYGVLANASVAKLFIGGIIPGCILAVFYMGIVYFFARRDKWPVHEPFSIKRIGTAAVTAAPSLTIPFIILGGILGGVFTATESAAVAVSVAAFLVFVVYRSLSWRETLELIVSTCRRTAVVMLIIAASGALGWFMANRQIPQQLASQLATLTESPVVIIILINLLLILLGTMISGVPAMILVVPVVLPVLEKIGMDPIQFGVIFAVAIAVGAQTPPVAATMLLTCVIAKISVEEMWVMNRWFILVTIVLQFLVSFIPALSLALPRLLIP
jgi:tripartite ATP-independent transporter DctM subunit